MEKEKEPKVPASASKIGTKKYIYAKGARKTSVAQVRLYQKGKGNFTINGKDYKEYFQTPFLQRIFLESLSLTSHTKDIDLDIKVHSGGINSQTEACRHGIARALVKMDETLKSALKAEKFLTRDPRVKERKKPGLKRARRAPQWSKR